MAMLQMLFNAHYFNLLYTHINTLFSKMCKHLVSDTRFSNDLRYLHSSCIMLPHNTESQTYNPSPSP
jgi:hypothetical protein